MAECTFRIRTHWAEKNRLAQPKFSTMCFSCFIKLQIKKISIRVWNYFKHSRNFHWVSKPIHLTRIRCSGWVRTIWIVNKFEKYKANNIQNSRLSLWSCYVEGSHFVSAWDEAASDTDSSECVCSALLRRRVITGAPRYLQWVKSYVHFARRFKNVTWLL